MSKRILILITLILASLLLAGCTGDLEDVNDFGELALGFSALVDTYETIADGIADINEAVSPFLLIIGLLFVFRGWQLHDFLFVVPGIVAGGLFVYSLTDGGDIDDDGVFVLIALGAGVGFFASYLVYNLSLWFTMLLVSIFLIDNTISYDVIGGLIGFFVTLFGASYLSWAYKRLVGLVAAFIGVIMISSSGIVGEIGFTPMVALALIGFWSQYRAAKKMEKDVFRRKNYDPKKHRKAEPSTQQSQEFESAEDIITYMTSAKSGAVQGWDIPVVSGDPVPKSGFFATVTEYPQSFDKNGNPTDPYLPMDYKEKRQLWDAIEELDDPFDK